MYILQQLFTKFGIYLYSRATEGEMALEGNYFNKLETMSAVKVAQGDKKCLAPRWSCAKEQLFFYTMM